MSTEHKCEVKSEEERTELLKALLTLHPDTKAIQVGGRNEDGHYSAAISCDICSEGPCRLWRTAAVFEDEVEATTAAQERREMILASIRPFDKLRLMMGMAELMKRQQGGAA